MENTLLFIEEKKDTWVNDNEIQFSYPKNDSKFLSEENLETSTACANISFWFFYKKKSMALIGAAGTGKTTVIKDVLKSGYKHKVFLCAPTHKAVSQFGNIEDVLEKEIERELCQWKIGTLQSGLGVHTKINEQGEEEYVITNMGKLYKEKFDYIIVDEASMVNKEQFYSLKELNVPVLFIGDDNQLPPVASEDFSVFNFFNENSTYILKEKKRFANERLKEVTYKIEDAIKNNTEFSDFILDLCLSYSDVIKGTANLDSEKLKNIPYIDYTNKGGYYHWVGLQKNYYIENEKYYFKKSGAKGCKNQIPYSLIKIEEKFLEIANQEKGGEIEKIKYKKGTFRDEKQNKTFEVLLSNPHEYETFFYKTKKEINKAYKKLGTTTLSLFDDDIEKDFDNELNLPYTQEQIKIIKAIKLMIPEKVNTVHTSQGSTFDTVLVNLSSFEYVKKEKEKANKEKLKLLYVAFTRAKHNIFIKF